MARYTRSDLNALCDQLNKKLASIGSTMQYQAQSRNGYTAIDLLIEGKSLRNIGTGSPKDCAFDMMQHALGMLHG